MITRRQVLVGASLSGVAAFMKNVADVFAYKEMPVTPVNFDVPALACDTHFHIFDQRFPYAPEANGKVTSPPPDFATVADAKAFHKTLHMQRLVIITPQAYRNENRCTLDAIKQFGSNARGVGLVDPEVATQQTIDELDRGGIRGVRINPQFIMKHFAPMVKLLSGRKNWHIQLQAGLPALEQLRDQIMASSMTFSIDHFASAKVEAGVDQPGFKNLLDLVKSGKCYIKLSGHPQRIDDGVAMTPLAKALIAANPERCIWGSDWPFVAESNPVDMGKVLNQLTVWAPTPALRKMILVDNPARLYHF